VKLYDRYFLYVYQNLANPYTFQAIAVGKKTYAKEPVFNIESANISCDEVVKLLSIDIDYQLNFDKHRCCRQHSCTMYHVE
jgi:hypothetical protein